MQVRGIRTPFGYLLYLNSKALKLINFCIGKQIMKDIANDNAFGCCPHCGREFNSELINEYEIRYCPYCGQGLKTKEETA